MHNFKKRKSKVKTMSQVQQTFMQNFKVQLLFKYESNALKKEENIADETKTST